MSPPERLKKTHVCLTRTTSDFRWLIRAVSPDITLHVTSIGRDFETWPETIEFREQDLLPQFLEQLLCTVTNFLVHFETSCLKACPSGISYQGSPSWNTTHQLLKVQERPYSLLQELSLPCCYIIYFVIAVLTINVHALLLTLVV